MSCRVFHNNNAYPHPFRQTNRHEQVSALSQRLHMIVLSVILTSAPLHH